MKNLILTAILLIFLSQCKKEKGPEGVQLDVPFYASIGSIYVLKDERPDSNGNMVKTSLFVKCTDVIDDRCFLGGSSPNCCMSSFGALAKVYTQIYEERPDSTYLTGVIGCTTTGQEWDTTNSYSPRFIRDGYRVFFLKLDPWEKEAASKEDYRIKYVIKRN
ncbi:MAG TPA: hypothetical protein VK154_11065 [Chitinophagales bacterium]|nr:hypothetical protein [Chitinophagales bacterium]